MELVTINSTNYCIHIHIKECSADFLKHLQYRMDILESKAPSNSFIMLVLGEDMATDFFHAKLKISFLHGPIAISTSGPSIMNVLNGLFEASYKEIKQWRHLRFLNVS